MRKTRVIALVALAFVSGSQAVGAQSGQRRGEQGQRAQGRGMMEGRGVRGGLLRGITLSETEKTRVKAIHATHRTEAQALHTSLRPAMQEARTARQKGDTAAARAALARTKGDREQLRALMVRHQTEVRSALSAENQRIFDTNVQQLRQRRADGRGQGRGGMKRGELRERRGGRIG